MNVLIVGCGREGSELARSIAAQGHAVTIVDANAARFDQLGSEFSGRTVQGVAFDRGVLERADIAHADAFVATTQSDNENIVAAKIARDVYKVPSVVARVYNPGRREIYERLGLATVTSTSWGARRIEQLILHPGVIDMEQIGGGEVRLLCVDAPDAWHGQSVNAILDGNVAVCAIERGGHVFVPKMGETLQPGDVAYLAVPAALQAEVIGFVRTKNSSQEK